MWRPVTAREFEYNKNYKHQPRTFYSSQNESAYKRAGAENVEACFRLVLLEVTIVDDTFCNSLAF